jgi:hypothetical protein
MPQRILCFTLILILSVQCFQKAFIVVNFYLNQSYIAKVFCENKDKPKLKCSGKCRLMKQLEQEEKKEQQLPNLKWDGKEPVISSNSFFTSLDLLSITNRREFASFLTPALSTFQSTVFHPPGMLV